MSDFVLSRSEWLKVVVHFALPLLCVEHLNFMTMVVYSVSSPPTDGG